MPPAHVLGPDWMTTQHYRVTAALSDDPRLRLRTRSEDDARVSAEFQSLLTQEIVNRFHLEYHRETTRDRLAYTLQHARGHKLNARQSASREGGRLNLTGTVITNEDTTADARSITFRRFCDWLQNHLKTPLTPDPSLPDGNWDFRLKWQTANQASLFAALKEQLGLELVEDARNQDILIVDRVERPGIPAVEAPKGHRRG
jgi:uncharacterized protein (TIGR03435 family)